MVDATLLARIRRLPFVYTAAGVLLLAAMMRLFLLTDLPPGLAQDEVLDAGIPAYILAGNFPLFFWQGYGHEPFYHYWATPFYLVFGPSVWTARLPAAVLGLALVALTMRWARREYGSLTAVVAGLGLALSWQPIIFSRVGIRPISEPLFLVAAAIFWQRRPWLAGLFLGLSFYTYTAARVVLLIPLLYFGLQWLAQISKRQGWRPPSELVRQTAVIFLVATAVAAPLQITLWRNPGIQQRVEQLSGPLDALRQGNAGPIIDSTLKTLGAFSFTGDPRWTYTVPDRPLFDPVTAVIFYAGLLLLFSRWRQPRYSLLLAWLIVTLLPSALTPQAPSSVRLVGMLPVAYLLPGLSLAWLWQKSGQWTATGKQWMPAALLLAIYGSLLLLGTIRDGFIRWPAATETRFAYQTTLRDMARHWRANPVQPLVIADPFFEPIDAETWEHNLGQAVGERWIQAGAERAGALIFPAEGGRGRLYVPEFAPLDPGLMALAGIPDEPIYRSGARPSFAVYPLPPAPAPPLLSELVIFEETIRLLGYQVVENGAQIVVYTHWETMAPLPWGLTIFLHLVDETGEIVSQHDGFDVGTPAARPGDRIIQRHPLWLPDEDAGADRQRSVYRLRLGLYLVGDGRRLQHSGEPPDFIWLP
jgi:4-amino-4-deoxy-L-arabinose transferase-like glycosyltransferase